MPGIQVSVAGPFATTVAKLAADLDVGEPDVLEACRRVGVTAWNGQSVLDGQEAARVTTALRQGPPAAVPPGEVPARPSPARSKRPAWLIAVVAAVVGGFVVLAATSLLDGDDDPVERATATTASPTTPTTPAAAAASETCPLFQSIRDHDDRSQAILNRALDPIVSAPDAAGAEAALAQFLAEYQPFIAAELPQILETYDSLALVVPPELAPDVVALRDFSDHVATRLASVRSAAEIEAVFTEDPERVIEVARGSLRLDTYSRDTCGIGIVN
jgi:hypothetical protein